MQEIYLQGNKDGDYIRLIQHKRQENSCTAYIEVGCCCVVTMRHEIPVEFITNLFTQVVLKHNGADKAAEEIFKSYDNSYRTDRIRKVKKWDGFGEERIPKEYEVDYEGWIIPVFATTKSKAKYQAWVDWQKKYDTPFIKFMRLSTVSKMY